MHKSVSNMWNTFLEHKQPILYSCLHLQKKPAYCLNKWIEYFHYDGIWDSSLAFNAWTSKISKYMYFFSCVLGVAAHDSTIKSVTCSLRTKTASQATSLKNTQRFVTANTPHSTSASRFLAPIRTRGLGACTTEPEVSGVTSGLTLGFLVLRSCITSYRDTGNLSWPAE